MTKNEFILEYALQHGAYPETSLLEQLTPCFTEPVVEEPQKVTCTSEDYKEKAKDYKYAKLLVDCGTGRGKHTFPKGFVFEISESIYGNFNLRCIYIVENSSTAPKYYYLTTKMEAMVITKCELLNEGTVSTIVKKFEGCKTINAYHEGSYVTLSRPVYSKGFEYKI